MALAMSSLPVPVSEDEDRGIGALCHPGDEIHDVLDSIALGDEAGAGSLKVTLLEILNLFFEPDGLDRIGDENFGPSMRMGFIT